MTKTEDLIEIQRFLIASLQWHCDKTLIDGIRIDNHPDGLLAAYNGFTIGEIFDSVSFYFILISLE